MQEMENTLFSAITDAESAIVSGGETEVNFDLNTYLFIVGAGTVFGVPGLTEGELDFAFRSAVSYSAYAGTRTFS